VVVDNTVNSAEAAAALWREFIDRSGEQYSRWVVETWFRPVVCASCDDGVVVLLVGDRFFSDWLSEHYLDFIITSLSSQLGEPVTVDLRVDPNVVRICAAPDIGSFGESSEGNSGNNSGSSDFDAPVAGVADGLRYQAVSGFGRRDQSDGHLARPSALGRPLNDNFSFDSFVVGSSNQFAVAAARVVAEKPGQSYTPLFIVGGVGLGKTHLLSAIGHRAREHHPNLRVVYTSANQFTHEVGEAAQQERLPQLVDRYRAACDMLLIDDVQLLAGREGTQRLLFHIFNDLYDSNRQIVITSDKLPHELPRIQDRLCSRFQCGLIADIQPPEFETRVAILRQKALAEGVTLSDKVLFHIAKHGCANVRELEGALVRVLAHASLTGVAISEQQAKTALIDILGDRAPRLSVAHIQEVVASYFHVEVKDLKSRGRRKAIVRPRQVAMYLCRKHSRSSYPELGARFGNKDHTTVMSACRKIKEGLGKDNSLCSQVKDIELELEIEPS